MESKEVKATETPVVEVMQVETGYDKQEPKAGLIAGLTLATFVAIIAVILGVQAYFDRVRDEQIYQAQLAPVSDDLKNLRNAEDEVLNSYKVIDKQTGIVQIPVKRAMELIAQEAAEGKLQYAQKSYPVKGLNAATGSPSDGTAVPGPAGTPVAKENGSTKNAAAAKP
jgi:stringent starvation protein B